MRAVTPGSSIRPRSESRGIPRALHSMALSSRSALPVAPPWGGRRERGGVDPDGATESNDGNGAAPDRRAARREVHAQPSGRLAHREEQGRVRREAWPVHGLPVTLRPTSNPSTRRATKDPPDLAECAPVHVLLHTRLSHGDECNSKANRKGARRNDSHVSRTGGRREIGQESGRSLTCGPRSATPADRGRPRGQRWRKEANE